MNVLIACEYSGVVRDAFIKRGHNAISCDLLLSDLPGPHYHGDIFDVINDDFDLMIAHPPCTHLCSSGARWFKDKIKEQKLGVEFFMALINAPIAKICVENPIGIMSSMYKKPTQYIHPWEYGHGETKKTCLWLKNLPTLKPTNIVSGRENRIWKLGPSKDRWKLRSKTYQGWADAMADQWG